MTALFIARREAIPHDGTRRIVADGYLGRQGDARRLADDGLLAELAAALREVPGEETARNTGREAWHTRQQRGGEPR